MEVFMFISAILLALFIGPNLYLSRLLDKKDLELTAIRLMHAMSELDSAVSKHIINILRDK